jgi:transposase
LTYAVIYNACMSQEPATLPDNLADAHRAIRELHVQLAHMQRQLEILLRQRFGPKSEQGHPDQLLLFGDPAVEIPATSTLPEPQRKPGHGRRTLPASLPRFEVVHDLPPGQKPCPECGDERARIGQETSEQLEYVPASLRVLVHTRPRYACPRCKGHVAIAARLPEPIDRGLPGVGLLAHVIVSKYVDHLPLYRQERIFARQGVSLSRRTTCGWMAECAGLLEPIWKAMKARLLRSRVIQTDDTPVPVQDLDLTGKNRTGRIWVYLGDRQHPFVVYDYTPDRKRDGPETFLRDYGSGYLQSDAFAGYRGLHARGLVEVGCWAHARRKFHESLSSDKTRADEAIAWIGRLYHIERTVQSEVARRLSDRGGDAPSPGERLAIEDQVRIEARSRESAPILDGFSRWLESQVNSVLPRSPLGEAIGYTRSNWQALTRYLEQPWLSIDNNASERAIRPIAVGRKNWLHLGSHAGGRTAAILLSVTQTAKGCGVEPWAYLRDVLRRVSSHPASRVSELLPDRWKASPTSLDPA